MTVEQFGLDMNLPSKELAEVAFNELRETNENCIKALNELRALLSENKGLYYADDEQFLLVFWRRCKFYPKSALFLKVDNYGYLPIYT